MAISEREYHIKILENLLSHYKAREKCEGYYDSTLKDDVEALQYAISSLKTDLKYDLMYEGKDIYTKADVVAMFEDLELEIKKTAEEVKNYDVKWALGLFFAKKIIQEKINVLKEPDDEIQC